jgi:hypothetical protein
MYPHLSGNGDGSLGESGVDRARQVQMEGVARPDPRFEQPPSRGGNEPAFDSAEYQAPQGYEVNGPLMAEFSQLANEFRLNQQQGTRALEFYRHATEQAEENYARQLAEGSERVARELHRADVQTVRELIADEELTPPAMRDWILRWGSHPDVAHMLTRWARAIRNGRY